MKIFVFMVIFFTFCSNLWGGEGDRVALYQGYPGQVPPLLLKGLKKQLGVSMKVDVMKIEDIMDSSVFNVSRYRTLILPDAPRVSAILWEPLQHFMKHGGDVVFLGGQPFSRASYHIDGEFLGRDEVKNKLSNVPFKILPKATNPQNYLRLAFTEETETKIKRSDESKTAVFMFIDAKDWYDTYTLEFSKDQVPETSSLLSFKIKAHSDSKLIYVELKERDGSRWFTKVSVSFKEWRRVVLMASDFKYISGGKNRAESQLNLGQMQSFAIGQNFKHGALHNGKYHIHLDALSISNELNPSDFPKGDLSADFNILGLYPYHPYDIFEMNNIRQIESFGKSPFKTSLSLSADYDATSTMGQPAMEDGFFIPVCSAYGAYKDHLGWAGGVVVNTAGRYKDSHWALFNMTQPHHYVDPSFSALLMEILDCFNDGSIINMKPEISLRPIKPRVKRSIGFLSRSKDGKKLLDDQGNPFFMVGSNYIYPANEQSFTFWNKKTFSAAELLKVEEDFRKMQASGINTIRIFSQDSMIDNREMNEKIKELCHRFGIQILLQIVTHSYDATGEQVMKRAEHVVSGFKNDPAVFAYDVQNEPQIGEIAAVRMNGNISPILQLNYRKDHGDHYDQSFVRKLTEKHKKGSGGYPKIGPWMEDKSDVEKLYAADAIWKKMDKKISPKDRSLLSDYPQNLNEIPELSTYFDALNKTFENWYRPQANLIRKMSPKQLVTVGYNRGLIALPFNKDIDFISQHSYFRAKSNDGVKKYNQIQDKLQEMWPNKPVTIGEFAYSSGELYDGEYISNDSSSVAELLMYLHSYTRGYNGAMRWRMNDDEIPATFKEHHWLKNFPLEERIRQARFGMYVFDGYRSVPKPIVHCLSFFRDYVDSYAVESGILETRSNSKVKHINTDYLYRAPSAYFVGNVEMSDGPVRFQSSDGNVAHVMSMWNEKDMQIMSTKTMEVTLDLKALAPKFSNGGYDLVGFHGPVEKKGHQLTITMIKGEVVTLTFK